MPTVFSARISSDGVSVGSGMSSAWVAMGMTMMNMMRRTSSTSMKGVTFMSLNMVRWSYVRRAAKDMGVPLFA